MSPSTATGRGRSSQIRTASTMFLTALLLATLSLLPLASAIRPILPLSNPDASLSLDDVLAPTTSSHAFTIRSILRSTLIDCLTSDKDLEMITPTLNDSSTYHEALLSHNVNFEWHPSVIVYPRTEEQVAHSLRCAHEQKGATPVAARSGSCSFAAFGTGGMDGSLVIDLGRFDFVKVLPVEVQPRAPVPAGPPQVLAKMGPGVRLGAAVKALWAQGKRGLPHGTCPQVGMGGHALCGGFGPLSRAWGLTTDNIVSMDVFLANGTKVTASLDENRELFWGMRGAGAKLGLVTSFTMRTHDVSGEFTNFAYSWTEGKSPITAASQLAAVAVGVQDFAAREDFPSEMGLHIMVHTNTPQRLGVYNTEPDTLLVEVRGMYAGPANEYKRWGDALVEAIVKAGAPPPGIRQEEGMDYLSLLGKWDDFAQSEPQKLDTSASRLKKLRGNFLARTHLTLGQRGFRRETLERAFEVWFSTEARRPMNLYPFKSDVDGKAHPPTNSKNYQPNCFLELFGGSNSAVLRRGREEDTAFSRRDALWAIQCSVAAETSTQIQESGRRFLNELDRSWWTAMADDGIKPASYSCYVDATLEDWREMYFGRETMSRLERLKRDIDPYNVVRNPQAIVPTRREGKGKGGKGAWIEDAHPMP